MMFILTLKDKPEGVFSVIDDTHGEQIIPIFESEDDAERYQEQLEFQTQRYKLQVLEIPEEVIIKACEERDQKYAIITEDDFIVPPVELV
jgi:hypothetical protein